LGSNFNSENAGFFLLSNPKSIHQGHIVSDTVSPHSQTLRKLADTATTELLNIKLTVASQLLPVLFYQVTPTYPLRANTESDMATPSLLRI